MLIGSLNRAKLVQAKNFSKNMIGDWIWVDLYIQHFSP